MLTSVALRVFVAMQQFGARTQDEDGQTLAEYSLIISAIAVAAVITGILVFREALTGAFNKASNCLNGSC